MSRSLSLTGWVERLGVLVTAFEDHTFRSQDGVAQPVLASDTFVPDSVMRHLDATTWVDADGVTRKGIRRQAGRCNGTHLTACLNTALEAKANGTAPKTRTGQMVYRMTIAEAQAHKIFGDNWYGQTAESMFAEK